MTNEEILATLIKADCCVEKAYWLVKNIRQEDSQRAGIADTLTQLLGHLNDMDSEIIDIMNVITRRPTK